MCILKKKAGKESKPKKFKLSDKAILFIKEYVIAELNIVSPIDSDMLDEITDLATQWEMDMIDPSSRSGSDKDYEYPERKRNELADKFVSEITGQWDDERFVPDFEDLNKRLGLS